MQSEGKWSFCGKARLCLLQSEWRWLQAVLEWDAWSSRVAGDAHMGTQHCHSCLHLQKQLVGQQPVSLHWEPPFALLADCNKLRKLPWPCPAAHPSKNRPLLGYSETSECLDSGFSVTETKCHRDGGRKIVKICLRRIVGLYLVWANDVIWFVVLVVSKFEIPPFLPGINQFRSPEPYLLQGWSWENERAEQGGFFLWL